MKRTQVILGKTTYQTKLPSHRIHRGIPREDHVLSPVPNNKPPQGHKFPHPATYQSGINKHTTLKQEYTSNDNSSLEPKILLVLARQECGVQPPFSNPTNAPNRFTHQSRSMKIRTRRSKICQKLVLYRNFAEEWMVSGENKFLVAWVGDECMAEFRGCDVERKWDVTAG